MLSVVSGETISNRLIFHLSDNDNVNITIFSETNFRAMLVKEDTYSRRLKLVVILVFCITTAISQVPQKKTVINTDSILNLLPELSGEYKVRAYFTKSRNA